MALMPADQHLRAATKRALPVSYRRCLLPGNWLHRERGCFETTLRASSAWGPPLMALKKLLILRYLAKRSSKDARCWSSGSSARRHESSR